MGMDGGEKFFTFNGSEYRGEYGLTASQEDYLEMILRLSRAQKEVRIHQLAATVLSPARFASACSRER